MTEHLFTDDAYLRECTATVTAVHDTGVELDRTVFYAQGGGQPGDTGTFTVGDGTTFPIAPRAVRRGGEGGGRGGEGGEEKGKQEGISASLYSRFSLLLSFA